MLERMEAAETSAPEEDAPVEEARERRGGFGSLGSIIFLLVIGWAIFLALLPLNDNSFFTHLATGRIILDEGSVPTSDPYSYTASGEAWTVQSWLPSVAYATAERLNGSTGLRVLVLVVFVGATVLVWLLTRDARSIIPRLLIVAVGMVVASATWSERPYMVGFIGLALLWLALEGRVPTWLLLPYGWVWTNSHGSFPLALVLCGTVILGTWLDLRRAGASELRRQVSAAAFMAGGILVGVLSPLGLKALTFPLTALSRSETFSLIREWQAPDFTSASDRAFLVLLFAAMASTVRSGRWRHALPLIAFGAMALLARRNMVMALPILLPVISAGAPAIGTLRADSRPALGRIAILPVAALVSIVAVQGLDGPALRLDDYPTRSIAFLEAYDSPAPLLAQDTTGNFLEVLDGTDASVFIDDRADMYPAEVLESYLKLHRGEPGWAAVLDEYGIETIIWKRDAPVAEILATDHRWRVAYSDDQWIVVERRLNS